MTTVLTTRNTLPGRPDALGSSFAGSFALHAALLGALIGWAYLTHSGKNWGSADPTAGSIQASMVSSIPVPPKAFTDPNAVLATENPSPAPPPPAPKAIEAPKLDAIPIPVKPTTKTIKTAEKTTPSPPLHPQPLKVDPSKATSGEAPAPQVAMSTLQTQAGTSQTVTDSAFGTRFAFYIQQINSKLASQWYTGMLDNQARGRKVSITFQIARDGSPSNIKIAQPSGDGTLDQTALNAVRHVDTFGPLPDAYQGSYVNAQYYFEPPPRQ